MASTPVAEPCRFKPNGEWLKIPKFMWSMAEQFDFQRHHQWGDNYKEAMRAIHNFPTP